MDGVSASNTDRPVAESSRSTLRIENGKEALTAHLAGLATREARLGRVASGGESSTEDDVGHSRKEPPSRLELDAITSGLNKLFEASKGVRFEVDDERGDLVVQVVDLKSDEVIRTIPPDRLSELHRQLGEYRPGVLLDDRA